MALLQIAEPGQSLAPHQKKNAIGIDLGTTNSLVAVVRSGAAETLPDERGQHLLPSVVCYSRDGIQVGQSARSQAQEDAYNTISSVKRLMGRGMEDLDSLGGVMLYRFMGSGNGMPYIKTRQGNVSPVQVSAEILKVLTQRAAQTLDGDIDGAVITVPAYFDDAQRQATKDAAKLAGLSIYRLLNEPTAAAIAYGLDRKKEGNVAVYDLGGGTFDISILRLEQGVFQVLSTGGDTALGGDDFDKALALWILQQSEMDEIQLDNHQLRSAIEEACRVKQVLTDKDVVTVRFAGWTGTINRSEFNKLIEPMVDKTVRLLRKALRDADVVLDDIRDVVMVGGSTRVPLVREKVAEFLGCSPLTTIDPDCVVSIGAALQAEVLSGNRSGDDMLLLDVNPLSLGLETMGGLMEKVILRNTTIPVSRAQDFTTYKDGQTAMVIHVFQGERELVKDNRSLARFELRGIPPMPAGAAKIRVTFQVDADGLLCVSASELSTGVRSQITVKPSYGLSDDEITQMIKSSLDHAGDDMAYRRLKEQQVEAERLFDALRIALEKDGKTLLSPEEFSALNADLISLERISKSSNVAEITAEIKRVSATSEAFAASRMNHGVKKALAGQNIDDMKEY
ncbi:Chaperone protein HscA [invertebrate metagenome]|uniref:Chaperone protein HscA n=1 Tax=invertebrate metagenome TaxID=1711999 RepID=A0A2H9T906_9ZZZZ